MKLSNSIAWLRQHRKLLVLGSGGFFLTIILFSMLLLPMIIKNQALKAINKATGRAARIEHVAFNPFGMTLTLKGFSLQEQDMNRPFVQLGSLRISLSSASFFRFVPVVDELLLEKLQVRLVRTAANRYNVTDIIERLTAQPTKKPTGTPRFSINNITLQDSSIDFDDQAVAGGKIHTVRDLQMAIPFISNIPYLAEKYTDPTFSAVINGARFSFSGKAKPLHTSMETDLNLKLTNLDLPHYLAYLPARIPVKLESGKLTLDLGLIYRIYQDKRPELIIKGLTRLDGISIKEKSNGQLASLKRFDLQTREIELFSRKVALQQITVDGLALHINRDSTGKLNFQRLLLPHTPPARSENSKKRDRTTAATDD